MSFFSDFLVLLDWLTSLGFYFSMLNTLFPTGYQAGCQFIKSSYMPVVRAFALTVGCAFASAVRLTLLLAIDIPAAVRNFFRHCTWYMSKSRLALLPANLKELDLRDNEAVNEY
ncbi:hypothetical protein ACHAQH_000077 [Verticillium albo-atrum]